VTLVVEGLSVRPRRHAPPVLQDVSFTVADGSIVGIGGASGSGKSTLLAAIAGLVRPSAGRIEVAGQTGARARARAVGYVGPDAAAEDELTPAEHLAFHASLRGIGRREREPLVDGLLELVDLAGRRDVACATLTQGLRRRLAIARALLHDPAVVLLDDPSAELDAAGRADLVDLLCGLADAGRIVLVAGGDLDHFGRALTELAVLDGGRLVAFGPLDSVLSRDDGRRQVRVRLADGSEQYYDVSGAEAQQQLLARLIADGIAIDELAAADQGIGSRLLALGAATAGDRAS
jgi:ABC-2 type transport system ATP-binding protein